MPTSEELDLNKYIPQMTVNGEPYNGGDFYLVKDVHLGESIDDRRPNVIVKPKEGVTEEKFVLHGN